MSEDIDAVDPLYYVPLPLREEVEAELQPEAELEVEEKPKRERRTRDCRCNELRHAAQTLADVKVDPTSTYSDIQSAKHRIEIAATRPWNYWDAFHDWNESRAARP